MSKPNNTATQTLNLAVAQKHTEKIALQPGQAIKLMIDGQLYTGQKTINGRPLRLVRKNDKLILEAEAQALAEVAGFFPPQTDTAQAAPDEAGADTNLLGALDAQSLFESGSSVQLAAADAGTLPAYSTPSWGTLIAQAATGAVSATTAATTTAAASTAAAATAVSAGAVIAAAVVAAVALSGNDDDAPAGDTTAPTVTVSNNVEGDTATGPVTYTFTFSEAVTGFDAADITVQGGTMGVFTAVSSTVYTLVVTPDNVASGSLSIGLNLATAKDAAGNATTAINVADQAYSQTIVNGNVAAGPLAEGHNLSVTIYNLAGEVLASGVEVNDDGSFTANLGAHSGAIVAVLVDGSSGNDYVDETSGEPVDLSTVLMAATTVTAGSAVNLNINPVTTVAAQKAGISVDDAGVPTLPNVTEADFSDDVTAAATAVATALNLGTAQDLLTSPVTTTVTADGASNLANANNYGKFLAVISAMDTTGDASGTADVLTALTAGINADGTTTPELDTQLQAAMTAAKVLIVDIGNATNDSSVAENTTAVLYTPDTSATVSVGTTYVYSLEGADAQLFNVNADTGAVTFKTAPNHEAPADAGANNVYNVTLKVTASNTDSETQVTQTSTDSIALAITVSDVADVAPVFTSGTPASVVENTDASAAVYTAVATPDVSNATVTYTLSGADEDLFAIANDGKVTFKNSPNYEAAVDDGANNTYNITVTATTGSVSSTQNVAITVTNDNEAPTATGSISTQTAVLNQLYTLNVATYFADVDANDTGTYTLTAGTLPAGLSLSTAGAITGTATATAASGSYTITRTDVGGLTASQTFTLSVVDKPSVLSFTVTDTDATSPNTATKGNSGETMQFVVTLSEAVTSEGGVTAVFTVNGVDVTATSSGVDGSNTITLTATVPATGNGTAITLKSLTGTITGDVSAQPLLAPTEGAISHSGYTVDNTLPTITSAYSVAENTSADTTLKTITLAANESVTWSGLSGDDASAFTLGTGANAGKLLFAGVTDKETKGSYTVTLTGTDDVGNAATQNITITLDNVNEAPSLSGVPGTAATAVVDQALALVDFAVADVDSATVTVTLTATNGTIGGVQDADANTAGIQVTGSVAQVNTALAAATFTAAAAGAASVGIAVSDGSLNATGTYELTAVTAPSLSTTLGGVTNLDARSNIVLSSTENVTAVAGKYITITNTGGIGFHGENPTNAFLIEATDPRVTINGGKITIDLDVDLDLANNYTLSIEAGAFLGAVSGQPSIALGSVSFSTVAPMDAAGGTAGNVSQAMAQDGTLVTSAYWLDLEDRSNPNSSAAQINAAGKDFVFVVADYSRATPPTSGPGDNGVATDDFFVRLYNFGSGDMLYIDNLGDNSDASLDRAGLTTFTGSSTGTLSGAGTRWKGITFAGIVVGDGSAAGDTTGGGLGSTIRLSLEASADTPSDHTVSVTYANLPTLLGTDIGNIFAVL